MAKQDDDTAETRLARLILALRSQGVSDSAVLNAIETTPRESFTPDLFKERAFEDSALPIACGQTISQPFIVGLMTQALKVDKRDRVLEIGTGSGYQAAVLAAMGSHVLGIERLPELADAARERITALGFGDRVEIRVGDGSVGAPGEAPWPRIIVAAAAPAVPDDLVAQLAEGGRLVIPVGGRWEQDLILVERHRADVITSNHGPCVFVPLRGAAGWA